MTLTSNFSRFLVVGAFATALQYFLLILGVRMDLGDPSAISGGAFLISSIVNFLLTRHFTFRSNSPVLVSGLRYASMISVGLFINSAAMIVLQYFGLHYVVAQMGATLLVLLWHFSVAASWVFPVEQTKSPLEERNTV